MSEQQSNPVPPASPPPILKRAPQKVYFFSWHCSFKRAIAEILIAAVAGMVAFVLPVLFMSNRPPDYEHAVFLPVISVGVTHLQPLSPVLMFAVGVAIGFFGRAPVWLTGPAIMLGFPVWAVIDAYAGGGGHDLIPFEIIFMYVVPSPFFIVPALIGRATRALIKL